MGSCTWKMGTHEGGQKRETEDEEARAQTYLLDNFLRIDPASRCEAEAGEMGAGEEMRKEEVDMEKKRRVSINSSY